jgi:chloramphenicol 3-O phosphotransferase
MNKAPGRIILLNGASSSGKSSIARELQRILPTPHLFAGIDSFTPMLRPDGHIGMDWSQRTNENAGGPDSPLRWVFSDQPGHPVQIEFGERGHRLVFGMHRALAELAKAGNDVIFEHVLLYPEWRDDLVDALQGLDVYLIGVQCSLDVVEERERARADRIVGQARGHYETVHDCVTYDVEVDTSKGTAADAAQRIAQRVKSQLPRALSQMRDATGSD